MSLGRLLSAARALTKLGESPSPYRVRAEALLPKFGEPLDPFASSKKAGAVQTSVPATGVSAGGKAARGLSWPWPRPDGRKATPPCVVSGVAGKDGRQPRTESAPVQGELRLDAVRVVCNDLRDADVEVVARAGGAVARRSAVASHLLLGAMVAEKALDRLADRIVGTGMH